MTAPGYTPFEHSFISKSVKVSSNPACTRWPRETRKLHVNLRKNGLRDGSMAHPKNPTSERWEGRPTHPIPCNPRDVSAGLHQIGGVAVPDTVRDPMQTFTGRHGLFNLVGRGDLSRPTQLRVEMDMACDNTVSWPRLHHIARQGGKLFGYTNQY